MNENFIKMTLAAHILSGNIDLDLNSADFEKKVDEQVELASKIANKIYQKYAGV